MSLYQRIVLKIYVHFSKIRKEFLLSLIQRKGEDVAIGNYTIIQNPGNLTVGDFSQIGDFTVLLALNNITIGKNCRISTSCMITSVSHKIGSQNRILDDYVRADGKAITIKDNVWMGANCVILPGTTVGMNSIIAAGSVVRGVIPDNEIWGGTPAIFLDKIKFV